MEKLVLIDGNSLSFRAFFALPLLTNKAGVYTNAIYGFTMILDKIIKEEAPTHFMVAFDAGKTTFRNNMYSEYKGGREKTPDELRSQLPYIRQLVESYHIKHYELENYEADDIIGTLSKQADEKNIKTIIITGDRDLTQLASENVTIYYTKKGVTDIDHYTPDFIAEKYDGLVPNQIIDMKGLMGDKSDNIPGVPGIGEKTAIKLLKQYETVEGVYQNIDELKTSKMKEKLIDNEDNAKLSKELATINRDSPIEVTIEDLKLTDDNDEEKIKLFKTLEFKQLLDQMDASTEAYDDRVIEYQEHLNDFDFENITEAAIHFETNENNYLKADVLGFAIHANDQAYVVSVEELKENKALHAWLENENVHFSVYDAKKTIILCERLGIKVNGIQFDTMLASYILDPSRTIEDIYSVVSEFGVYYVPNDESIYGKGKKLHVPENEVLFESIAKKVTAIYESKEKMIELLKERDQFSLHDDLELPLARVLAEMEHIGITVDKETLKEMQEDLKTRLDKLIEQIHSHAGTEFNINSPKQLGVVLFEDLKLPIIKKTKTGYSTAVDVLEQLRNEHPIIEDILVYRQLAKLQSTYIEGLQKMITSEGKIHTRFNQTLAQTGRLSSIEPNLQNIPIRLEEGRKIRKAFRPSKENHVIFAADYSQIELRVLADITGDEHMKEAFTANEDIHTTTAMRVFNVDKDEVTSNMRRQAKAVNFGIVYGISDYGLSQSLGITRKAAKKFIDDYLDSFPKVKEYMDTIVQDAKQKGYVETLLHRRRYTPDITNRNFNLRSFAERTAMNTPIQGSAADIIKLAMVQFSNKMKDTDFNAKLLLQVHDELIFEVPEEELEAFKPFVEDIMDNALELSVPLSVESSYGETWYDAK
ncbi:DNA polymerase I [Mammaliicoccus vitulinus]|uniref:DNA polymerase I n=3 Tax=Mammaliicoccus vitulinus TaxID=71237 RepID=A0A2T4PV29_9STAP|nr:DNA polymerase I [Mammaliicoccus vitulinus]PTI30273.1 DNA polymerase I [Mammaliicoccus vitulinus]QQT16481.1 DNA polymerase I [Mammaliicoccus vitulinus]QQY20523.1 DNA polymerase I [Mammaliicoccus vitulinus]RIN16390.1 DNA polymerase I [Mammaliicoccus vitulinus]RTX86515.1 DNA polymerase I [Mammaliicoccus vitulinus]